MSIYRSAAGKQRIHDVYDRAVDALPMAVEDRWIETRHGETHLLVAGPADGEPVLLFHGGNATNPLTLSWYADLADEYRLLAPDTIGQPGKSAETRVDPRGDGYGEWVVDLLDALDLGSVPTIGTSYGAGIVLRTAAFAPDRIESAALVVPAGFGTGPLRGLLGVGLPAVLYRYLGVDWLLDRTLAAMATEPDPDPVVRATVGAALRHVDLEREFPGATAAELAAFDASVTLVFAETDPFFPPDAIEPRARERLPNVARVVRLDGERHLLSRGAQRRVTAAVREFVLE